MNSGLNFVSRLESAEISFAEHEGPFSIKCAFGGSETYWVDNARHVVDDRSYLILNHGQRYSSEIDSASPLESFCIWFEPGFERMVHAATNARSWDDPYAHDVGSPSFFQAPYVYDGRVSHIVHRLRTGTRDGWMSSELMEELFHELTESVLTVNAGVRLEIDRVPAQKRPKREELYRRLRRSREFLDSNCYRCVQLSEIARVADLSTHYFLRLFQQVYGESPREYQTRSRMERAGKLLIGSDMPVTQVCFEVGFESLGSFSWDFRRRFGMPPSKYRRIHGRDQAKIAS